ncbi:hypothetical protein [Erythrobacter sp. HKB08]|uniref:hypothetical protein n=1 Tax=Erythrobacter sp. HKB08 TaxID=2502843 RepID=UPI0010089C56|nr:hypothetical protein [Erythrobacter sp. HKB08]
MSYQPDGTPKIIFGGIAIVVVGLFLFLAGNAVLPYFYEAYQRDQIEECEDDHPVATDAWTTIFGFDMGGRYIVGDGAEDRALIECIVDSLSVRYVSTPLYGQQHAEYPALSIVFGAFDNGYGLTYYSGSEPFAEGVIPRSSTAP